MPESDEIATIPIRYAQMPQLLRKLYILCGISGTFFLRLDSCAVWLHAPPFWILVFLFPPCSVRSIFVLRGCLFLSSGMPVDSHSGVVAFLCPRVPVFPIFECCCGGGGEKVEDVLSEDFPLFGIV